MKHFKQTIALYVAKRISGDMHGKAFVDEDTATNIAFTVQNHGIVLFIGKEQIREYRFSVYLAMRIVRWLIWYWIAYTWCGLRFRIWDWATKIILDSKL